MNANVITKKAGPLPRWSWVALGGGALVGGYYYYTKQQDAQAASAQVTDQSQGTQTPQGDYVAQDNSASPQGLLSLYGYGSYTGYNPSPQQNGPSLSEYIKLVTALAGLRPMPTTPGPDGHHKPPHHKPPPDGTPKPKPVKPPPFKFPPKSVAAAKQEKWKLKSLLITTTDDATRALIHQDMDLLDRWIKQHKHPHHKHHHDHHHQQPTSTGSAANQAHSHTPLEPLHLRMGRVQ